MKKILSLLLVVAMLLTCMVACGKTEEPAAPAAEAEAEAAAMPGEGEIYCVIMSLGQLEFFDALKAGVCDSANKIGAQWYFAGPQEFVPDQIAQAIDQAVAKGIVKKNTASRKKSQLALKLNKVGA